MGLPHSGGPDAPGMGGNGGKGLRGHTGETCMATQVQVQVAATLPFYHTGRGEVGR